MNPTITIGPPPSVSVIMPVYNGARYLHAAIDSVIAQTFVDWELIAIDDGSTDDTPRILEQSSDPRLVVLRQPNAGEAAARNAGLDRARGTYIAFLDADDTYLPDALGALAHFLDNHTRCDVVYSDGQVCDAENRFVMRLSDHRPWPPPKDMLERIIASPGAIGTPSCTMLRRAAVERHAARFDTSLVIGCDWDFWIQLAARHAEFGYFDQLTMRYRLHATNITRTSGPHRRREDLLRIRMKVVDAPWFADLSAATRRLHVYQLLTELLSDDPERQTALLRAPAVSDLAPSDQAFLWRQVGTDALVRRSDARFALFSLNQAVGKWQGDWRSRSLLWIERHLGLKAAQATLRVWGRLHREAARLRTLGRRVPRQMPSALLPETEHGCAQTLSADPPVLNQRASPSDLPRVGVVVVNWDALWDTQRCIDAVRQSTYRNYDLFVVDNGVSDSSVAALRHGYPDATIIPNGRNLGFAGGYNVGIRAALARGNDAVLLINDDTVVASGALHALAEAVRTHPRAGFFGPKICTIENPQLILSAGGNLGDGWKVTHRGIGETDCGQFDTVAEVEHLSGCALLVTRQALDAIGLLDEEFFAYYEDVDWCYRARQAGLSLLFVPQATVWHPDTRTRDAESPLVTYYTARNSLLFARRHRLGAFTMAAIIAGHARTLGSWSLRPRWHHKREQRDALLRALADFAIGYRGSGLGT